MTEHLSSGELERYLARTLAPADVLALHGHLETCPDCRNMLAEATMARMPPAVAPLLCDTVEPHLSEEEMVAFVARRMAEPKRAETARHVAACPICRESVAAMESVRHEPAAIPVRRHGVYWLSVGGAIAAAVLIATLVHYRPAHKNAAPAILATLRDGDQTIELDATGALRGLEGASPEERELVRDTLQRRSLPAGPALPADAPGTLLAPGAAAQPAFALTAPMHTRVLSDQPVFTWHPYAGATAYQVLVTNERLDPLARSGRITATEWQPETPLPRGVALLWQVRAWHGGEMVSAPAPPAPPARFEIAGAPIAARLEELRTAVRPSHLLAAAICAREGLRDEAAKEVRILARENPDSALIGSLEASSAQ